MNKKVFIGLTGFLVFAALCTAALFTACKMAEDTELTYTVVFYSNFGNGEPDETVSATFIYGETNKLEGTASGTSIFESNHPGGLSLIGWSTVRDGSMAYAAGVSVQGNLTETDSVPLYAIWGYIVDFRAYGGALFLYQGVIPGNELIMPSGSPARAGFRFDGWVVADPQVNPSAALYDFSKSVTSPFTLHAKWAELDGKIYYTVTFDSNGGGTAPSQRTEESNTNITLPGVSAMAKAGSAFTGWNTRADGKGTSYIQGDTYKVITDSKLYAQWIEACTVKFDINGGSGTAPDDRTEQAGQRITLPVESGFTKTGHTLSEWNTMADGSGSYYLPGAANYTVPGDITLYAIWQANSYRVIYDANGGNGAPANTNHTYGVFRSLQTGDGVDRTGYTFTNWNTDRNGNGNTYPGGANVKDLTSVPNGTVTLYAQWRANTYTVKYDPNYGGGTGTGTMTDSNHTYDTPTRLYENKFKRDGYGFYRWATQPGGGGRTFADNAEVTDLSAVDKGSVTLFAQWTAGKVTLSYNASGGNNAPQAETVDTDTIVYLPGAGSMTRAGYTFNGWTDAGGSASYSQGYGYKVTETVTLFAKWTPITYTVVYNANGGIGSQQSSSHEYGTSKALTSIAALGFSKTGYTFGGWATSSGSATVAHGNGASVSNLTTTPNGTYSLYAIWTPITYTVRYEKDNDAATGSTSDSYHTYDANTNNLNVCGFSLAGHGPGGWATSSKGPKVYNSGQPNVGNLSSAQGDIVKLYAVWVPDGLTVKFNLNGGLGSIPDQSVTYGGYAAAPDVSANPTQTGYTFAGWYDAATGGSVFSFTTRQITANTTIYAQWTPIKYTVAYDANGGAGTTASGEFTYNTSNTLRANGFNYTGYAFQGWSTASGAGNTVNYDGGQTLNAAQTNALRNSPGTVTLYAVWKAVNFTVAYNNNGGSGTMGSSTFTYNTAGSIKANEFTRRGYAFIGWTTVSGGTAAAYSSTGAAVSLTAAQTNTLYSSVSSGTVNIYAVWKKVEIIDNEQGADLAAKLTWLKSNALSSTNYTIYLEKNEILAAGANTDLYYSGYTGVKITLKSNSAAERTVTLNGNGPLFTVGSGVTLVLEDYAALVGNSSNTNTVVRIDSGGIFQLLANTRIRGNTRTSGSGGAVYVNGGTFTLNGGEITGNSAIVYGSAVYVDSGTFNMSSGTIGGSTANANKGAIHGGGVCVAGGNFTMSGGTISYNEVTGRGGGVYFYGAGNFTMENGTITCNKANFGGGVYFESNGEFKMSGGVIGGSAANANSAVGGGGVLVSTGSFNMTGDAKISYNTATATINGGGGGVCLSGGATFTMNGNSCAISFNTSGANGGGIFSDDSTLKLLDGSIKSNSASHGGGVCFTGNGTFTMSGGYIGGSGTGDTNTATYNGGGVCLWGNATFTMNGGTIYMNKAGTYGGGVYVESGPSIFKKSGSTSLISNNSVASYVYGDKRGHTAYVADGPKIRDSGVAGGVNLDSTISGSSGGWEL